MVKAAVFTIVKNEAFFLPKWLEYYRKSFADEDIYILDHQSEDGSTEGLPCTVIPVEHEYAFNARWLKETVKRRQRELLKEYDMVLFAEADEFVIPNPKKYRSLATYIDGFSGDVVSCTGFNVVHQRNTEPALDTSQPILAQRHYWYPSQEYNKPLLSRIPLNWRFGFHKARECKSQDPDLWLVHLHKCDYSYCKRKTEERSHYNWKKLYVLLRLGFQNRLTGAKFDRWFDTHQKASSPLIQTPESIRELV